MRLALVIRSSYAENTVVARRDEFADNAACFAERVGAKDAAFEVVSLDASRELPEALEELLRSHAGTIESLLVHFTGYIAVKGDRGPALLLDGSRLRAFPLSRLRAAVEDGAEQSLVIINGLAVVDADQAPDFVAKSVGEAVTSPNGAIAAIVGIEHEPGSPRRGPQRLTDLFVLALNHLASKTPGKLVSDRALYQTMQGDAMSFADIAGVNHRPGYFDFVLLPGPTVGGIGGLEQSKDRATQPVPIYTGKRPSAGTMPAAAPVAAITQSPATEIVSSQAASGATGVEGEARQDLADETAEEETSPHSSALHDPISEHRDAKLPNLHTEVAPARGGERRFPTLADTPRARAASQRDWISEAAYFPSAPPPAVSPVQPGLSRPKQTTLPGITERAQPIDADADAGGRSPSALEKLPQFEHFDDDDPGTGVASQNPALADESPQELDREAADAHADFEDGAGQSDAHADFEDDAGQSDEHADFEGDEDTGDEDESEQEEGQQDAHPSSPSGGEGADSVIALYEDLLARLDASEDPRRAEVQAKLGDALRDAQRTAEALFAYERALDIDPQQPQAFDGACALYLEERDFAGLVSTIRRRMETTEDAEERLSLLDQIAEIWLNDAQDIAKGIDALEERLTETPGDLGTLQLMVDVQDRVGDALGRIESRERLAKFAEADPDIIAAAWLEATALAHDVLRDPTRTFRFLASAVGTGALLPDALARAEELLGARDRWLEVVELYELSLDTSTSVAEGVHFARRLLEIVNACSCQDALKKSSLSAIVRLAQHDVQLAESAIALVVATTHGADTLELLQGIRVALPLHDMLLHTLVAVSHSEHPDVATNLSSVLVSIDEATEDERALAAVLSTDTLPTPRRALEQADYETLLYPTELDREMTLGLARLEKALFAAGAFEKKNGIAVPKDAPVIDPETSTVTLARSFLWTSRLLSVKTPELVLLTDAPTLFRYLPQSEPRILVSRSLGSGFSLPELVYLAARHSAVQLPGMIAREHYPDPRALGLLIYIIGVVVDGRKIGVKSLPESEQKLGKRLLAQLRDNESLEADFERVVGAETPDLDMCEHHAEYWLRTVDQVRLRAALLACGTPSIGIELNRRYPLDSLWTTEEQIALVAAYAGSPEHCELRSRLEIAAERTAVG